jgi:3-dehydroquinate dehydratase-2
MNILVLHGPNLNLFGRREPHIYGNVSYAEINRRLQALARELKTELVIVQSNHEGVLVDAFHEHMDSADGAILNPGGLTQYSVSLHDCIKAMPFPTIECHMSNLAWREEWRHHSIISSAVKGIVQGFGWRSYMAALRLIVELAGESGKKAKPPSRAARRASPGRR